MIMFCMDLGCNLYINAKKCNLTFTLYSFIHKMFIIKNCHHSKKQNKTNKKQKEKQKQKQKQNISKQIKTKNKYKNKKKMNCNSLTLKIHIQANNIKKKSKHKLTKRSNALKLNTQSIRPLRTTNHTTHIQRCTPLYIQSSTRAQNTPVVSHYV